jgi:replicative DNA helicase
MKNSLPMPASDLILDKGLPVNLDAERFVLGSILLDDSLFVQVAGDLQPEDFALEKHRLLFHRMTELHERGEKIDRVTVYNELLKHNEAEACDGLAYLVSLDDGLPRISNVDAYVRIVRDKSLLRRIIFTSQKLIDRCMLAQEEPEEILGGAEEALLKIGDTGVKASLESPREIIDGYEGGINALLNPAARIKGLSTGLVKVDELTGGLHAGELFILAARPSMGKTAMALNIAQHVATGKNPKPVAVFSLEMTKESLLTRMLCAAARVDGQKFRAGYLNRDERNRLSAAATTLSAAPLFIDDTSGANLMDVHAKLRRLKAEQRGLGLVIIDYLQLMSGRGRFENRNQEISTLSRGLKMLAKELECPMMVLSQQSRAPEIRQGDRRPQLSDLRDSGSIEQDADLVGFIFREEVYKPERQDLRGLAELILAKQRNGPTGVVKLVFLKHCTKFENHTSDLGEESAPPAPPEEE